MVCPRCIMAVEKIFSDLEIKTHSISLGEVLLPTEPDTKTMVTIKEKLEEIGFELLGSEQHRIVEKIKTIIIEAIQNSNGKHIVFSNLLSDMLHKDYSQLSRLFSSVECITIEQYVILQKIEKVKELITYGQLTLSEIAFLLGYSSVAHLSSQFKKVTGMPPSEFKKQGLGMRKGLDKV